MLLVLDTNVLIGFLTGRKGAVITLRRLWRAQRFTLALTDEILAELYHSLQYPDVQQRHQLSPAQLLVYLSTVRHKADVFPGIMPVTVAVSDKTDKKFLSCADEASADALVTGDPHLLRLHRYKGIHILTPAECVEKFFPV